MYKQEVTVWNWITAVIEYKMKLHVSRVSSSKVCPVTCQGSDPVKSRWAQTGCVPSSADTDRRCWCLLIRPTAVTSSELQVQMDPGQNQVTADRQSELESNWTNRCASVLLWFSDCVSAVIICDLFTVLCYCTTTWQQSLCCLNPSHQSLNDAVTYLYDSCV